MRETLDPVEDLARRVRQALMLASTPAELRLLFGTFYADIDAACLDSDEVRRFLLASCESEAERAVDHAEESVEIREWLSDWLAASPVEQVYRACDDWAAAARDDLMTLEREFAGWAACAHPGPVLLLGLKARSLNVDGAVVTDAAWAWLHDEAPSLLARALATEVPEERRYLVFCADRWFRCVLAGLTDGRTSPRPEVIASATEYRRSINRLSGTERVALALALSGNGYPIESLRLHRGVLRERQLARDTLKQIEDLVRFDDRPTRAVDRALREVRSYAPANLVRYVGPSSVRSLLATCLEAAVDAEQQELARQLLSEADQAAKESKPPAGRIPSGSTMTASRARPLGTS